MWTLSFANLIASSDEPFLRSSASVYSFPIEHGARPRDRIKNSIRHGRSRSAWATRSRSTWVDARLNSCGPSFGCASYETCSPEVVRTTAKLARKPLRSNAGQAIKKFGVNEQPTRPLTLLGLDVDQPRRSNLFFGRASLVSLRAGNTSTSRQAINFKFRDAQASRPDFEKFELGRVLCIIHKPHAAGMSCVLYQLYKTSLV